MSFFSELKRRNVFRTGAAYAVVVWIILQVAAVTFPPLGVPDWVMTGLIIFAIIGLPITVIISWFYELTPGGVMTAKEAAEAGYQPSAAFGRQIDFVIIGLLVVAVGWLIWRQEAGPAAPEYSVAVLPFANASADPDEDYFSDGLSEELMFALAQIEQLKVAGRTSSFFYKGKSEDMRVIGESLGVLNVLEGSVRRSGDQLRITAQLIRVADGFSVWSETYERPETDVFAVQDEIMIAVLDALGVDVADTDFGKITTDPTDNIVAYNYYLSGRYHMGQLTPGDIQAALDDFNRAIKADADYADAWAGLARTYGLAPVVYLMPYKDAMPLAHENALKALELDPENVTALDALMATNLIYFRDLDAMDAVSSKAIDLEPNNPNAIASRAHYLEHTGRLCEANALFLSLLEFEPLSPINFFWAGGNYFVRAQYGLAIEHLERAIALSPEMQNPYLLILASQMLSGNEDAAEQALTKLVETFGEAPFSWIARAYFYGLTGNPEAMDAEIAKLIPLAEAGLIPGQLGHILFMAGDLDRALPWLEMDYELRDEFIVSANVVWDWDKIAAHPGLDALWSKPGLAELRAARIANAASNENCAAVQS